MASRVNRRHMLSLISSYWKILLLALVTPLACPADKVETKDGSIIYGKIIGAVDGNLSFETTYSTVIEIPLTELISLSSSHSLSIRDDANNTLYGQSVPMPKEQLNLRNKKQTDNLAFENIQHLWIEESKDPFQIEEEQLKLELLMKWKSSIGLDLVGSSGNSDSIGAGFRLDSTYSNKFRELDLFLSYNTQKSKGVTDTDETKGGAEYDSLFRDRLAWYLRTDFEHDPIEQINLRSTGAIGLKYDWIESLNYQVSTRFGTAVRFEDSSLKHINEKIDPAFDLGLEYTHLFIESLLIESEITLLPKIDDLSDYLFYHDTALIFPVIEENSWHIRSGLSGTFDAIPEDNSEKMDMKYYFRVVYEFN